MNLRWLSWKKKCLTCIFSYFPHTRWFLYILSYKFALYVFCLDFLISQVFQCLVIFTVPCYQRDLFIFCIADWPIKVQWAVHCTKYGQNIKVGVSWTFQLRPLRHSRSQIWKNQLWMNVTVKIPTWMYSVTLYIRAC